MSIVDDIKRWGSDAYDWAKRKKDEILASIQGTVDIAHQALLGKSLLPNLEQKVDVYIAGNPRATRYDMYWQAAAIAFGLVRPRAVTATLPSGIVSFYSPPANSITLSYNSEERSLTFSLFHSISWAYLQVASFDPTGVGTGDPNIYYTQIFHGPIEEYIGGNWVIFSPTTGGFPKEATMNKNNPYVGATMLTPNPMYEDKNPRMPTGLRISDSPLPSGDGVSRGWPTHASDPLVSAADLMATYTRPEYLVWSALSTPCGVAENTYNRIPTTDLTGTPHRSPPADYPLIYDRPRFNFPWLNWLLPPFGGPSNGGPSRPGSPGGGNGFGGGGDLDIPPDYYPPGGSSNNNPPTLPF